MHHPSVPHLQKPHPRLTVDDWTRNIQRLQNEARIRRYDAWELRQRANQLRNDSRVTTCWDNYVNNELLRDRIFDVDSWREQQRFTREAVRDEIRALKEEKNSTELMLESLQVPLSVVSQCLSNRDQRVPPELTRDQLGEELNNELYIIENSKRTLTDLCHMGWEKIKELTNVLCRLEREIKNKEECIKLDTHVKDLDRNCSGISYKLDPTRIPAEAMTEHNYDKCIENTISIANQLMAESKALRESMFRGRETATNQMHAQCQTVELMMRRRVFDLQRARDEMDWQKYKLEDHLRSLDREISQLRAAVADKIAPTKLVETRLEMRTRRPVLELVRDRPMRGLTEEYERLHMSSTLLEQKLEDALRTYHGMQEHLNRLEKDLQQKCQALETDGRLVKIRTPLHAPDETETQRNARHCRLDDRLTFVFKVFGMPVFKQVFTAVNICLAQAFY